MKKDKLTQFLLGLLAVLLAGIGAKVWEGVEIARENQIEIRHIKDDVSELREDVDAHWSATSVAIEEVQ